MGSEAKSYTLSGISFDKWGRKGLRPEEMSKKSRLMEYLIMGFAWLTVLGIGYLAYIKITLLLHWVK